MTASRLAAAEEKIWVSPSSAALEEPPPPPLDPPPLFLGMNIPGTSSTFRLGKTKSGLPPTRGVSGAAGAQETEEVRGACLAGAEGRGAPRGGTEPQSEGREEGPNGAPVPSTDGDGGGTWQSTFGKEGIGTLAFPLPRQALVTLREVRRGGGPPFLDLAFFPVLLLPFPSRCDGRADGC